MELETRGVEETLGPSEASPYLLPLESGLPLTIQPQTHRDSFDCWETLPSGSVELINLNYLF